MKEHAAFLAGNQEHDVDFGDDIPLQPARIPRMKPVPTGKDVAYLRAQKRTISEQRHAVAAKTLAGSGRKTLNRRKAKSVHEEFVSEEESDDEEEDQDYEDEGHGGEEELEEVPPKVGKGKAMAKLKSKPRKTRNPTAAQLAEESKEKRRAAAVQRCIASAAAEVEGVAEYTAARKRVEGEKKKKVETRMANRKADRPSCGTKPKIRNVQAGNESSGRPEIPPPVSPSSSSQQAETTNDEPANTETLPEYEVLDSDSDDTETELCFYDDDEELQRVRVATRAERISRGYESDEAGDEIADDQEVGDGDSEAEQETYEDNSARDLFGDNVDSSAAPSVPDAAEVVRGWHNIEKDEMVAFAQDEANMTAMRLSGWEYGKRIFMPHVMLAYPP
ncbi:Hypothetical protein PHPALM_15997 [Phytophthora palmivora]|uniref:Uncharacterized protein n=1 Tax=Phytophthora palmivora TaxID=4796 RepID=A0A2P4XQV4_9STRA|nr:Hypothetical protein PHPALM_15997 [Phytophthora palmivora]